MKVAHPSLSGILLEDGQNCLEWIIELPKQFLAYVQELLRQMEGGEGGFVLSEGDRIQDISKKSALILNPFAIDINCKKVLMKLYDELNRIAYGEKYYLKTQELTQRLQEYICQLEGETDHILDLSPEIELSCVFKAFDLKYEVEDNDFLEKLVQYMKIMNHVLGIEVFFLVNIRSYLDDEQMKLLTDEMNYQEIQMIFMENRERDCLSHVKRYIIDKDLCEIYS